MKTTTIVKILWPISVLCALYIGTLIGGVVGQIEARRSYRWSICTDLKKMEQSFNDPEISRIMSPLRDLIWAVGGPTYHEKLNEFGREMALHKKRIGSTTNETKTGAEPPAAAAASNGQ